MKFYTGLWEHENAMDVFIEVLRVQYQDNKRAKLIVIWWNKGWVGEPFPISQRTRLKITKLQGWRRVKQLIRKVPDEIL